MQSRKTIEYDPMEVRRALSLILGNDQVTEIRVLGARMGPRIQSGYFTSIPIASKAIAGFDFSDGLYFTPNPVDPTLRARANNRIGRSKNSTGDKDILRLRYLLVDLDPERPSGISSSDEEHDAALQRARDIRAFLSDQGLPEPIFADSGNGGHLMYRVDLATEDSALVKRVLEALADRFNDGAVKVDTSVHNPARIWKLYGTVARKGDSMDDRPHRLSRILEHPEALEIVTRDQLEALASTVPEKVSKEKPQSRRRSGGVDGGSWIESWIEDHGLEVDGPNDWNGGQIWKFAICPWNPDHTDRSAYIAKLEDGKLSAGCHHNSCGDYGWHDLRELFEPEAARKKRGPSQEEIDETKKALIESAKEDAASTVRQALECDETILRLALLRRVHSNQFEAAMMSLRDAGVKVKDVETLSRAVNDCMKSSRVKNLVGKRNVEGTTRLVADALPGAPVTSGLSIPPGFGLDEEGTLKLGQTSGEKDGDPIDEVIAPAPVLITGRYTDVISHLEHVELTWFRDGKWRDHTAARATIAETRALVTLAGVGFPVTSNSAKDLVEYLARFESTNLDALPHRAVTSRLGWQSARTPNQFLWGHTLIDANGRNSEGRHSEDRDGEMERHALIFRGCDGGEEQLADAFHAGGSFELWKDAVSMVAVYPAVILGFYVSLAPAILPILGAPNFLVDWSYATSTGKTTILRLAGSVWGNADERSPSSVLGTWDATATWIERAAVNGIPLILDDTKRARWSSVISSVIYGAASGRGRGRGSIDGTRRTSSWSTVVLSTGERPVTGFTEDGGTRGRVIALWGAPFGKTDESTGRIVNSLNAAVAEHYGHAGPAFVEALLRNQSEWEGLRKTHEERKAHYIRVAGSNPVGGRLAAYLATIDVAAQFAHQHLALPWEWSDPIEKLLPGLLSEASESDRAGEALRTLATWAQCSRGEFWSLSGPDEMGPEPLNGWIGRWDHGRNEFSMRPDLYRKKMDEWGFDSDAVLKTWKDREWLRFDKGRLTKKERVGRGDSNSVSMIALSSKAIAWSMESEENGDEENAGNAEGTSQLADPKRVM